MDPLPPASSSAPKRPCPFAGGGGGAPATMDSFLEAFLDLQDPFAAFELSLERAVGLRETEMEKDLIVESAMQMGSALLEAAKRAARRRATKYNAAIWPLPHDLTVKVFSMLDTRSLCHAAVTCSMFKKCGMDSLCYANIDLTAIIPKVNNAVVSTMIQRAGKNLQSLKLGIWPASTLMAELARPSYHVTVDTSGHPWNEKRPRHGREASVLTRSCLLALSVDDGASGALLKRLYLYNIDKMDSAALSTALSACSSLIDLELVGLHVELKRTLESVSMHCHSMERLFFESSEAGRDDSLKSSTCVDLINGCPLLASLALKGFKLHDHKVRILVKGFRNLKIVDLSTSYSITGAFLRNLGNGANANALEVLILRDCLHLKEMEVVKFLSALLAGDCQLLRYLDISNKDGLSSEEDWNNRCYNPSNIPKSGVLQGRPDVYLIAEFPQDGSFIDIDHISGSEISSSGSLHSISNASFGSYFTSSSDSNYSSDPGSGNEDFHDVNFAFFDGESFDELEFSV